MSTNNLSFDIKATAKPQDIKPQDVKPNSQDIKPQDVKPNSQDVKPQDVKPNSQDVKPQDVKPNSQDVKPQDAKPKPKSSFLKMDRLKKTLILRQEIKKAVIGQEDMILGLLIGLFSGGHILIEGFPGLAKTLAVSTIAKAVSLPFRRIQFTPDLLPSDIIGTMVFNASTQEFSPKKGPVFTNILLADEINRAPAKSQSALLEAMEERQVSIGDKSWPLPHPFMVLATQNPIEQEGTFILPEAQRDRFLLKLKVEHPKMAEEMAILNLSGQDTKEPVRPVLSYEELLEIQDQVRKIHIDERIKKYIVDLVLATRAPRDYGLPELESSIELGASPRATVSFPKAGQALALLEGKDFVSMDNIKKLALPILRHRLILSYEAQAENITEDQVIRKILKELEL